MTELVPADAMEFAEVANAYAMAKEKGGIVKALRLIADKLESGVLAAQSVSTQQTVQIDELARFEIRLEATLFPRVHR